MEKRTYYKHVIACIALAGISFLSHAVDALSIETGTGNKTNIIRAGALWNWESRWWQSNGTHIGGYWDANISHWRGKRYQGIANNHQNLNAIGVTPVFRFQSDSLRGSYFEGGIGAYYLSTLYDNNDDKLSTRWQFGDHIGFGYVFANQMDLALRIQHFSNGGVKQPNDGVNFLILRLSYPLK